LTFVLRPILRAPVLSPFLVTLREMAALSALVGILATASVAQAGIYPDNHWEHATKLTTDNADEFVKTNVDAGKTVVVRWIASEG